MSSKQKRMFYIYAENLDFYESLENKSLFINDALQDARIKGRVDPKKPRDISPLADHAKALAEMQERDKKRLENS